MIFNIDLEWFLLGSDEEDYKVPKKKYSCSKSQIIDFVLHAKDNSEELKSLYEFVSLLEKYSPKETYTLTEDINE